MLLRYGVSTNKFWTFRTTVIKSQSQLLKRPRIRLDKDDPSVLRFINGLGEIQKQRDSISVIADRDV